MEDEIKNKKPGGGESSKGYYKRPHNRPDKPVVLDEAEALKHVNHVKTVKVKKLSEETIADITKDIERLEKEIDLEIKEIQSAKLSF